jgi:hypothetical protein
MAGSAAEAPTSPDTPPVPPPQPSVQPVPHSQPVPDVQQPAQDGQPASVRASDADRAETVDALREEFAAGRLSHQTFLFRMNAAMEARHVKDLPPLLADLPPAPQARPGVVGRIRQRLRRLTGRPADPEDTVDPAGAAGSHDGARRLTSALRLPPTAPSRPGVPPSPLPFPRTNEGFYTIGRDPRNDMSIEDMSVSRIHARLERSPSGWLLKDLSSTNGTRVNGWRVRGQVAVRAGDVVRFGDIEFVLTEDTGNGQRGERPQVPTH